MKNVDLDWEQFVAKSEEYVHRKTDVKHISDFARLAIFLFPVLESSQWWEDDIELPDAGVTDVEDRFM